MANVLNGNTWYADTVHSTDDDDIVRKQLLVSCIIVTATADNARIVLGDSANNPAVKIELRVKLSGDSKLFRFDGKPLLFPGGIRVLAISNAVATVVIQNAGG